MQKTLILISVTLMLLNSTLGDEKDKEEIHKLALEEIKVVTEIGKVVILEKTEADVSGIPIKKLNFSDLDTLYPELTNKYLNQLKVEKIIINPVNDTIVSYDSILPREFNRNFSLDELHTTFKNYQGIIYFSSICFYNDKAIILTNSIKFKPYGTGMFYIFEKREGKWYLKDSRIAYK